MSRHRWLAGTAMLWSLVSAPSPAAARPLAHGPVPATSAAPTPVHPIVLAMVLDLKQGELGRWTEISSVRRPSRVVELCASFLRDYPQSAHRDEARALEAGASRAVAIKREVGLTGEFFEATRGDAAFDARQYFVKIKPGFFFHDSQRFWLCQFFRGFWGFSSRLCLVFFR